MEESNDEEGQQNDNNHTATVVDGIAAAKKKLKRKLADACNLDQYDGKFGIRLDTHGDVVMMTDESEVSSLNDEDVDQLREECNSVWP